MKTVGLLVLAGACLLSGGGRGPGVGSMSGLPSATISATTLAFDGEAVGTASSPQTITLSNSGTAMLSGVTLAASAPFTQTNTCGSTLGVGANCVITVTFTPLSAGDVNGTVSITDNAIGSPQIVELAGSGTVSSGETLTGACIYGAPSPPPGCRSKIDIAECPVGQQAKNPGIIGCGPLSGITYVDSSSRCMVGGRSSGGYCESTIP